MDLKDFVAQSLVQIVEGVATASKAVSELGGAVSPSYSARLAETLGLTNDGTSRPVQGVQFDVAVTASSESSGEAGGGLRIAVVSFGAKGSDRDSHQTSSRISFSVPLALPVDPVSASAAKARAEEANRKIAASRVPRSSGFDSDGWMSR